MSPSAIALSVIFGIVLVGSTAGFIAGTRHKMNLEQWTVGGRGFGLVLVWLLMAGEVYTTFAFLGASGWAYSRGGPTLYIIAYLVLAYAGSFYFLPNIWEVGKKFSMQTESDYFEKRYGSKLMGAFVALVGVIFIIPYLQLQVTGLGLIVNVASFDGIDRSTAMIIGITLVAGFVFASGVRGVAWVSALKDVLMLSAAIFLGIGIPYAYFGGIGEMFTALANLNPSHLVMPGSTKNMGHSWYISTVLLTSFGFYMWPHLFGATFTAKSGNTLRRNAVIMPLYTISLPLIFFVGFASIMVIPGLSNGDMSLLTVVQKTYPAWFLGLIGGAGAITAMVPAAILTLTAATLFVKNFYRPMIAPSMTDDQVAKMAKILVVVISAITLYLAIYSSTTLVGLLLLGYAGVTQFFPGVIFGLYWRRVTLAGVFTGMIVGVATVAYLSLNKMDPFLGLNAGFFALCVNMAITVVLSLLTPMRPNPFEDDTEVAAAK